MWWRTKYGRARGFNLLNDLVVRRGISAPIIVETGTLRNDDIGYRDGDGWSTVFFRKVVDRLGGELHSVDVDVQAIETSRRVVEREFGNLKNTFHHVCDSVAFLDKFSKTIDVLYLDSMNYTGDDSSAKHQLGEIQACIDKLATTGIVMVDDICETLDQGKAALSVPFLKNHGWTEVTLVPVAERQQRHWYQAIITRPV